MSITSGMFTSDKDDWETPKVLFDNLNARYHFTLDAASSDANAKCEHHFTQEDDGLSQSWNGERVFCNPPYGRQIKAWVEKASREADNGTLIVMLLPARTDTSWFHEYIYHKAHINFLRGRLKFEVDGVPRDSAPFPSMIAKFNCELAEVVA